VKPTKEPQNQQRDPYSVGKRLDAYWEKFELDEYWESYVRFGDQILGRCNVSGDILLSCIKDEGD
jgi:hypothetical protein